MLRLANSPITGSKRTGQAGANREGRRSGASMWKRDDPGDGSRWMNVYFIVFGTLNAVCILLSLGLTIAALIR